MPRGTSPSLAQQLQLSREVARLVRARQPLEKALAELARASGGSLGRAAEAVGERLAAGESLAQSLAPGSSRGARMLAATIDIGQSAGRLDVALESWTSLHASLSGLRQRLFAASVYPALLMIVAVVSLTTTAWQLIPHYERAFAVFSDRPPMWLGAIAWINRYLGYCVALFLLAMLMPPVVWWWRRRGVTALGVYREESSRCYLQSHVARLAVLALHPGRPVSDLVQTLERAAGRPSAAGGERDGVSPSPPAPNEEAAQQLLGRETMMTLAALEGGIVEPDQCQALLDGIAVQTKRQGDAQAQRTARWLPMFVALIVGAAVATTYVALIYGPWLMLFQQIVDPTEK